MKRVFLDAGHGGYDPGASGFGYKEKDFTLSITNKVKKHLERHNITVILSRNSDVNPSLTERTNKANANKVDVSVSIHCNAFNGVAKGVETFHYTYGSTNSTKLATCIQNSVINAGLYNTNRGVKAANLHMCRETNMPSCLIETAFIDNAADIELLKNKQEESHRIQRTD